MFSRVFFFKDVKSRDCVVKMFPILTQHSLCSPFPNKPWFLRVYSTSLLKTLQKKEKLLITSNFSSSHGVFYLFGELSVIFINLEIVVCQHFQFGRVLNWSFWKGSRNIYLSSNAFHLDGSKSI